MNFQVIELELMAAEMVRYLEKTRLVNAILDQVRIRTACNDLAGEERLITKIDCLLDFTFDMNGAFSNPWWAIFPEGHRVQRCEGDLGKFIQQSSGRSATLHHLVDDAPVWNVDDEFLRFRYELVGKPLW